MKTYGLKEYIVYLCFNLDWMMIYLNPNLHQKLRIHLVRIGKLSIVKLRQKILVQVERVIQIMGILLRIVVDLGKENLSNKIIEYFSEFSQFIIQNIHIV